MNQLAHLTHLALDDLPLAHRLAPAAAPGTGQHEMEVRKALMRALVCRQDRSYRIVTMCNQADYVPRDRLQVGTAWLTLDIEALWEPNLSAPTRRVNGR